MLTRTVAGRTYDYSHSVGGRFFKQPVDLAFAAGDVVFISPDDIHQFRNTGDSPLKFLCLIPNSATGKTVTVVPECGLDESSNG